MRYYIAAGAALILAACQSGNLNEQEALEQLKDEYTGVEQVSFNVCPEKLRVKKTEITQWGPWHPCDLKKFHIFDDNKYYDLLLKKYPVIEYNDFHFMRGPYKNKIGIIDIASEETLKRLKAIDHVQFDKGNSIISVKIYDYAPSSITGLRQRENGGAGIREGCDAIVEYKYNRTNLAPWADTYLTRIKQPKSVYEACFQKYDDGWRLKK